MRALPSRLIAALLFLMSLGGIGISAYLTTVHYAGAPLVCTSGGVVNCEQVLTSSYSSILGIPWSVGGIVWFAIAGLLALVSLRQPEPSWLQPAQFGWMVVGLATVVYLVGVEAVALHKICLWCTAGHVLIVLMLVLTLLRTPVLAPEDDFEDDEGLDSEEDEEPASRPAPSAPSSPRR